jgi:hypothetical protein
VGYQLINIQFMKKFLFLLVLGTWILTSCDAKVNRPDPVLSENKVAQQNAKVEQALVPEGVPLAASGVQHYVCPNACAGSGGDSTGTCSICGSAYEHNQAFHDTPAAAPVATSNAATTPEPPQNDAGIWHYTCSNGCSGGAGSTVACSQCGNMLTHNTAYHN